jgi:Secretion system C-terminal sorting domain
LGVQAQWQNLTQAKVSWQVADQQNIKAYVVQYSEDGNTYTDVCSVTASNNTNYDCIVAAGSTVKNYYRVKELDADGKAAFSKVVLLQYNSKPSVVVYPNPVKDKLYITGLTDNGSIKITTINGSIVLQQNIVRGLKYIDISRFTTGIYVLTVTSDKETKTLKIFKQQ